MFAKSLKKNIKMEQIDTLKTCPCGKGGVCYETPVTEEITSTLCMKCGFTTNSLMLTGSKELEQAELITPELYKDLKFTDELGRVWYPTVINKADKGMIFLDGSDVDSTQWAFAPAVEVLPEEESKYMNKTTGEPYKYRIDMTQVKYFPKDEFMAALMIGGFAG